MSNRPGPTPNRPNGTSTGANGVSSRASKIARARRYSLSPYPRTAVNGKGVVKQGFPETAGRNR